MAARKKPSMLLPELLQKRMILLLFFVYMGVAYFGGINMNQDMSSLDWVNVVGWSIFSLAYLLLAVFKKETQVKMSATHLILLLVLFAINTWVPNADPLLWFLWGICFVAFAFNIRWALVGKE